MSVPVTAQPRVASPQLHLRISSHAGHLFLFSPLQTRRLRVEVTLCNELGHKEKSQQMTAMALQITLIHLSSGQAVETRRQTMSEKVNTETQLMQAVAGQGQRNRSYLRKACDEKWHGNEAYRDREKVKGWFKQSTQASNGSNDFRASLYGRHCSPTPILHMRHRSRGLAWRWSPTSHLPLEA